MKSLWMHLQSSPGGCLIAAGILLLSVVGFATLGYLLWEIIR